MLIKSSENDFIFFTCILPDYVAHEITKEFWKHSHFEKMIVGFLLRCQNLLNKNTPEIMHFHAWKILFSSLLPLYCYCSHQMWSVIYLDDILNIIGDHNTSQRQLLLPWINISITNYAFFSLKWVLTFSKLNIFSK